MMTERRRRFTVVLIASLLVITGVVYEAINQIPSSPKESAAPTATVASGPAADALEQLVIKGRAPKTGYSREQFGAGWQEAGGCDVRNRILARDMTNVVFRSETDCTVTKGVLPDPYTDKIIEFVRGQTTSDDVQIDHIVALSDAWQKGAQQLSKQIREAFANDGLNLLAVDGPTNMAKGDGDAATWLPPHRPYRCQYVARQIAVKQKYTLYITQAEHDAMGRILSDCPHQVLPIVQ